MKEIPGDVYGYGDEDYCDEAFLLTEDKLRLSEDETGFLLTRKGERLFIACVNSKKAKERSRAAKLFVSRVSKLGSVSAIGVSSSRLSTTLPIDGFVHSICVIGNLDNKSFNEIIRVRDEITGFDELPIMPLDDFDDQAYETVWVRSLSS